MMLLKDIKQTKTGHKAHTQLNSQGIGHSISRVGSYGLKMVRIWEHHKFNTITIKEHQIESSLTCDKYFAKLMWGGGVAKYPCENEVNYTLTIKGKCRWDQMLTSSNCSFSVLDCFLLSSLSTVTTCSSSFNSFISSSSWSILVCADSNCPFHCLACSSSFRVTSSCLTATWACSFSLTYNVE